MKKRVPSIRKMHTAARYGNRARPGDSTSKAGPLRTARSVLDVDDGSGSRRWRHPGLLTLAKDHNNRDASRPCRQHVGNRQELQGWRNSESVAGADTETSDGPARISTDVQAPQIDVDRDVVGRKQADATAQRERETC